MRRIRHLTPQYIYSKTFYALYRAQKPDTPWLTQDAIDIIEQLILSSDQGVEFGSGSSTKWFAERCAHLTSIEHDAQWYQLVSKKIIDAELKAKVNLRLCSTENEYLKQISTFEDYSLDFCLVDGKYKRDKVAIEAIKKIKSGGILIVDNANWYLPNSKTKSPDSLRSISECSESWKNFYDLVRNYRCIWTSNNITDTAIWFIA